MRRNLFAFYWHCRKTMTCYVAYLLTLFYHRRKTMVHLSLTCDLFADRLHANWSCTSYLCLFFPQCASRLWSRNVHDKEFSSHNKSSVFYATVFLNYNSHLLNHCIYPPLLNALILHLVWCMLKWCSAIAMFHLDMG